jgi:Protein of unknown function (DUF2589)
MAIDTTPSTVATNALQAIPFSSLIGGPLDACIQAQAMAAKTSWEFIKQVGLTIDPETNETKAINVTFEYNNNGQMTTLVVPLIILLPIPYMAIDTVTIDFMANISAASSSVVETSEDSELGVAVDATAALKVGPFALSVTAKANYSAKSHSKAAQDSRYSVEYTMQVHVAGGQADMPAGLQTVLNILQGSVTSISADDLVAIYPASIPFNQTDSGSLQVTVKNNQGIVVESSEVSLQFESSSIGENPFESIVVSRGVPKEEMNRLLNDTRYNNSTIRAYRRLYGKPERGVGLTATHKGKQVSATQTKSNQNRRINLSSQNGDKQPEIGVTNNKGQVSFILKVKEKVMSGVRPISGRLLLTADVPMIDAEGKPIVPPVQETQFVTFQIIPDGRQTTQLVSNLEKLTFTKDSEELKVEISTQSLVDDSPIADCLVTVQLVSESTKLSSIFDLIKIDDKTVANATSVQAQGKSDNKGKLSFDFTTHPGIVKADNCSGKLIFSTPSGQPIEVEFEVQLP